MKKTAKEPKTKTRLPASRAHLWANCGGSVKLKGAGNPFAPFDAARKGVLTHNIAASHLIHGQESPVALDAWEKQLYNANKDEIDTAVKFYVDFIVETFAEFKETYPDAEIRIEREMTTETELYIFQGPPDVYFVSRKGSTVRVFDLKSGWVEVSAELNEQLILYGHQIAKEHKLNAPTLTGTIVQPLLSQIDNAQYTYDPEFFDSILIVQDKFVVGAHCAKCPALTVCNAAKEKIRKYVNPEYADDTTSREKVWHDFLPIAKPGEEFFKKLQSEAKQALELGVVIEGWGLGKGRAGKRVWKETVTPDKLVKELKVKKTIVVKTSMESPATIEKGLSVEGKAKLAGMVFKPEYATLIRTDKPEAFMSAKAPKKPKKEKAK